MKHESNPRPSPSRAVPSRQKAVEKVSGAKWSITEALEPRILFSAVPIEVPVSESESVEVRQIDSESGSQADFLSADGLWKGAELPRGEEENPNRDNATAILTSFQNLTAGEISQLIGDDPSVASSAALIEVETENLPVSLDTLDELIEAAELRWEAAGLSPEQLDALDQIEYQFVNLEGRYLGAAEGFQIYLDLDAAGEGWFVDTTPLEDEEFIRHSHLSMVRVVEGETDAFDLLSVIMHEQGHVLGLPDVYRPEIDGDLMHGIFEEGERRLPAAGQAEGAVAGSLEGIHHAVAVGTVKTSQAILGSRSGDNLVNDAGLNGDELYNLDGTEAGEPTNATGVSWQTATGNDDLAASQGRVWVVFDLGVSRVLDSVDIWNFQWNLNGTTDLSNRGTAQFDVYVRDSEADTDDGTAGGTPINVGGDTSSDALNGTVFDLGASNPWTLVLENQTLAQAPNSDTYTPENFDLSGFAGRFVAIVADSGH